VVEGNRELDVATKGLDSEINRAVRSTRQVERTVDDLIDRLSELSASGTAVEGIVSTVAALARRINMLAMNARIEAAHAGPAGRGFAVVADEVKQLASMTRDATASIVEVMRTMDANTETAITGIEEIRPVIAEIVELTSLSRTALDRQTDIAERIIDAVGRARASVSDTDCAMRNLDQVIGSSERLGRDLSDAADELGSRSAQLQKSAGQFADGLRKAGGSGAA
jgi:methyl-accepting chemotaxis protein